METQFEAICEYSRSKRTEFYRYALRKRIGWVILYAVLGPVILLGGILIHSTVSIVIGVFELLYGIWVYFRPWYLSAKAEKKEMAFSDGQHPASVVTFGEEIVDVSPEQTSRMPYDKVKKLHLSKTMVFIIDVRDVAILVDKDGFRKGNYEDFLQFIREKCPQAKITVS